MKKILLILVFILILSCSSKKTLIDGPTQIDGMMKNIGTYYYYQHQMDSMCIADTLPNLNDWQMLYQKDYETDKILYIYFFIKQDTINNKELLYKAEKEDSILYKVTKRLTE